MKREFMLLAVLIAMFLLTTIFFASAAFSQNVLFETDIHNMWNQTGYVSYGYNMGFDNISGQAIYPYTFTRGSWSQYPDMSNLVLNLYQFSLSRYLQEDRDNIFGLGIAQWVPWSGSMACTPITSQKKCYRHGCNTPLSCPIFVPFYVLGR